MKENLMETQSLRDQFIKSALRSCRHFNGIQNKKCQAGVEYKPWNQATNEAMPCLPESINGRSVWECASFEMMSREEAEQEADARLVKVERTTKARHAAKDDAKAKGYRKGAGGHGKLPCPCCDGGTLQYSVASYNGHMHAKCTTAGCVSWME